MTRHPRPVLIIATVAILAASLARGQSAPQERWTATWAASLLASPPRPPADSVDRVRTVANRALRQIVRVSAGGSRVRIRLSNQYGDGPLVIGSAHVAPRTSGAAIDPATDRPVTFNGRSSVVMRAGANLVMHPIVLAVPQLSDFNWVRVLRERLAAGRPEMATSDCFRGKPMNFIMESRRQCIVPRRGRFDS